MATQQWKTVSIRVSEHEENALKLLCEKRGKSKHAIIKEIFGKEIEPITRPGRIPEGEGIPLIGEHIFKYNVEKDNFTWQIDLGVHGIQALAENVPSSFVENLNLALQKAIDERGKVNVPKKKTLVPKSVLKYKVKQNAGI